MPVRPITPAEHAVRVTSLGRLAAPKGQPWMAPVPSSRFWPLGSAVRFAVTVADATPGSGTAGSLQDPGRLALCLRDPGRRTREVVFPGKLVRDAQGAFHADLILDVSGRWAWRWVAQGAFAGATEERFFVVESVS